MVYAGYSSVDHALFRDIQFVVMYEI
jgi:hypothetical protein